MDCVEIKTDENKCRYLAAKRDIKQGEVIILEEAIIAGPSGPWDIHPICLSCYKRVYGDPFYCNGCKWPFCCEPCAKNAQHAKFECRIFKACEVKPSKEPQDYFNILILRCCLMKESNAKKFDLLMKLAPTPVGKKAKLVPPPEVAQFIGKKCKKTMFDDDMIAKVVQIVGLYGFATTDPISSQHIPRNACLLFHHASLLSHDCVPNTSWVRIEKGEVIFNLKVWATVDVPAGSKLTCPYLDITRPHIERRFHILEVSNAVCPCARCMDPTELGTFYGSVRCQQCKQGFMLSLEPAKGSDAEWKCQNCDNIQPYRECTVPIETEVFEAVEKCQDIEEFEEVLGKYENEFLHPNHWLMMDCRRAIVTRMVTTLAGVKPVQIMMERAEKMLEYCNSLKIVTDAFYPGWNKINARHTLYTKYAEALINGLDSQVEAELERIEDIIRRGEEMSIYEMPEIPASGK